jgi:hypothetical protein
MPQYTRSKNKATKKQGGEHSQRGIHNSSTNTDGNYIQTTPMPLQNESKRNDNRMKERQPPSKNIEILISLYLIINDFSDFNRVHLF